MITHSQPSSIRRRSGLAASGALSLLALGLTLPAAATAQPLWRFSSSAPHNPTAPQHDRLEIAQQVSPHQASSVYSPGQGVLCDRSANTCYDNKGVSLSLTRQFFGPGAERQLMATLSGRPAPQEFRLSDGSVCNMAAQLCWSDGYGKRRINRTFSRDLFGGIADRPNPGGNGWNDDREITRYSGICTLAQGGRELYDGQCALRRISNDRNGVTRYVVAQPDGRRYNFTNRSGRLEVTDASGTWPVFFFDHGYTGVFRWRDMTLVATREHRGLRQSRDSRVQMDQLFLDP